MVDKEERLHIAGRGILIFAEMLEAGGLQVEAVCGECGLAVGCVAVGGCTISPGTA